MNSSSFAGPTEVSTYNLPLTVSTGSNRAIFVGVGLWQMAPAPSSSTITWQGTNLSLAQRIVCESSYGGGGSFETREIWELRNPQTGSSNLVFTFNESTELVLLAAEFTGVHGSTPGVVLGFASTPLSNSFTIDITTSASYAGWLEFQFCGSTNPTLTPPEYFVTAIGDGTNGYETATLAYNMASASIQTRRWTCTVDDPLGVISYAVPPT
jgi:hypothetical protein